MVDNSANKRYIYNMNSATNNTEEIKMKFEDAKNLTGWRVDNNNGRKIMTDAGALLTPPEGFAPCLHRLARDGYAYVAVLTSTSRGFLGRRDRAYYSLWAQKI